MPVFGNNNKDDDNCSSSLKYVDIMLSLSPFDHATSVLMSAIYFLFESNLRTYIHTYIRTNIRFSKFYGV
jgi:hypothetical protein